MIRPFKTSDRIRKILASRTDPYGSMGLEDLKELLLEQFFLEAVADDRSETAMPPPEWL